MNWDYVLTAVSLCGAGVSLAAARVVRRRRCVECGGRPGWNDHGRCDACAESFLAACRPDEHPVSSGPAVIPPFGVVADLSNKGCTSPPDGWLCTREAGHDGPCAAMPDVRAWDDARR